MWDGVCFSKFIQRTASTWEVKPITEIKQLGSLQRRGIHVHSGKKKKRYQCSFLFKENHLSGNSCLDFQIGKLPLQLHQVSNGEGIPPSFFLWSLMCTRKIPWDESCWSRKDHDSNDSNNTSVRLKCSCGAEFALQRTFTSIPSCLIIMTTPGGRWGERCYHHFTHRRFSWGGWRVIFPESQS